MLRTLSAADRLQLMKFVCSFAWADLEVHPTERLFVKKMAKHLGLTADEMAKVDEWLDLPPRPEEVDPADIPRAHRELFLDAARKTAEADGQIDPAEQEQLEIFEQLLRC